MSASGMTVERLPGRLILSGRLDERARLPEVAASIPDGTALAIDLADVAYINSLGVRDWVVFLRRLGERRVTVALERCAEVMILQMNMINGARGAATVVSFHAPFACETCGWEGPQLVVSERVKPALAAGQTPEAPCPECGAVSRFADFIDRYFLFLAGG